MDDHTPKIMRPPPSAFFIGDMNLKHILELAKAYHRHTIQSLPCFPERAAINLETASSQQKPPLWLLLPASEAPDAYADTFITRVRLLGVHAETVDRFDDSRDGLTVDISNRLVRSPNRFPSVLEIPQAVVWFGLDFFVHIRFDSIRKTLANFDRLMASIDGYSDDISRATAAAIIVDQISSLPLELFVVSEPYETQYFGTGQFSLSSSEVVIDAGAADGDSLRKFLSYQPEFSAWHAFEPDPALTAMVNATVAAVGQGKAKAITQPLVEVSGPVQMRLLSGTGNTHVLAGHDTEGHSVEGISIDDFLGGQPATIIKMDVEGYEPALLRGARKTILTHRPKLLISAYHEVEHMFEIPDLIRSMRSDYTMAIRNHTWAKPSDSWPGSFFCETVIYAY